MTRGAPASTYRLQLGPELDLDAARRTLEYLEALGVDTVYLSPVLASRRGSGHGYDVVDPTRVDPELGGERALEAFLSEMRDRGMGALLDIVPNHMAASLENPWWRDVLTRGRGSPYARFFDIDWRAHDGKVLLPLLAAPLDEEIARGRIEVGDGVIRYGEVELPAPGARPGRPPAEVLEDRPYRLGFWREAVLRLSYRRFFDVSDLVAVRADRAEVFRAMHGVVVGLVRRGLLTGVRVDHVDGLHDPQAYLERLRRAVGEAHVVVEKILARGERMPAAWPVEGTSGYEFADAASGVLTDPAGAARLDEIAARLSGDAATFGEVVHERKRQVLRELFPGEVRSLAEELARLARASSSFRSVEIDELRSGLVELTAALPVYRTYVRDELVAPPDRRVLREAFAAARERGGTPRALALLRSVVMLRPPAGVSARACLRFVLRWQRLTGPAMAKGLEDTAMYVWNGLVSRNEVGGDPGRPPIDPEGFHRVARTRLARDPGSLNATSTHDSKRSEDVRARIAVLSEVPDVWEAALGRLRKRTRRLRPADDPEAAPDPQEELLLYQQTLGAWPVDRPPGEEFTARLVAATEKAMREAKTRSSWLDPDERHEEAVAAFVRGALADPGFRREIAALDRVIAVPGASNGLAQLVLKVAAPGVPDLYQGTESWHQRLVDPDNRAPVDFERPAASLAALERRAGELPALLDELRDRWRDGRIKLLVTAAALRLRREPRDLFARGAYVPLPGAGRHRAHVLAFARRRGRAWAIAVVTRLPHGLAGSDWPIGDVWGRTSIPLPGVAPRRWRDALGGDDLRASGRGLHVGEVLRRLPVALLVGER